MPLSNQKKQMLQKEIPILRAEITALYRKLDSRFRLYGAQLPIDFSFEEDKLGAYMPQSHEDGEHFEFSLPNISYAAVYQLSKSDREDLYKHEYAHYMNHHIDVPKEYLFEPGVHGSSWRYCCSLIGAVPSAFYKVGESLKPQDYEKALTKKETNYETSRLLDNYHREQTYRQSQNTAVKFEVGESITHPKFGEGTVEKVEATGTNVRLTINFNGETKILDQKWVLKSRIK